MKLFRRAWSAPVGGMLTAQPLFVPSVAVGKQTVPLLLVASADNSVVALDAMRGTTVWQRSLGPVRPQVCGGSGGIESTPVVDTGRKRVYVIGADGALRALSLSTGKPIAGFDVPIIRRTDVETVWGALRISGNLLYVPVAPSIAGDQGFGATPMLFQPPGCPPLLAVNSRARTRTCGSAPRSPRRRSCATSSVPATETPSTRSQPIWVAPAKTLVVGGASLTNGGAGAVGLHVRPGCTFTTAWQADIGGCVQPQPLAVGGVVFVSATATHTLAALDASTGRLVASFNTVTPAYTAPMTAGSLVVVGTANGTVIAFGAPARVSTGSKTR